MKKQGMIAVTLYNKENENYTGENLHEVLHEMWSNHFHEQEALDGMHFTVIGKRSKTGNDCRFANTFFHYCFAENAISAEELVEFCQTA